MVEMDKFEWHNVCLHFGKLLTVSKLRQIVKSIVNLKLAFSYNYLTFLERYYCSCYCVQQAVPKTNKLYALRQASEERTPNI